MTGSLLADPITGRVVRVADGDTITLLAPANRQIRVRLASIDAPEKGQPFANVSRKLLSDLVAGQVVLVIERDVDRYGRTVGTVELAGHDVNLEQVRRGLAWVYERYFTNAPTEIQHEYRDAQELARSERKGLWTRWARCRPESFGDLGRRRGHLHPKERQPNQTRSFAGFRLDLLCDAPSNAFDPVRRCAEATGPGGHGAGHEAIQ